jgi:hypothetical protein
MAKKRGVGGNGLGRWRALWIASGELRVAEGRGRPPPRACARCRCARALCLRELRAVETGRSAVPHVGGTALTLCRRLGPKL